MKHITAQSGFTLIEAMITMTVLTVGILSLYTLQISAIQGTSTASQITRAATAGASQLERIFVLDYKDLVDSDGDGTNQDANKDGVDDDGANFGLGDAQCCPNGKDPFGNTIAGCTAKADGCAMGLDNDAIYWNVAVDEPMPATTRVRVLVARRDRGVPKTSEYEYIKARIVQK